MLFTQESWCNSLSNQEWNVPDTIRRVSSLTRSRSTSSWQSCASQQVWLSRLPTSARVSSQLFQKNQVKCSISVKLSTLVVVVLSSPIVSWFQSPFSPSTPNHVTRLSQPLVSSTVEFWMPSTRDSELSGLWCFPAPSVSLSSLVSSSAWWVAVWPLLQRLRNPKCAEPTFLIN